MLKLLYNYTVQWFKRLNTTSKVLTILLALLLVYTSYTLMQKGYYRYKYFKSLEKQVKTLNDSLEVSNEKILNLLYKSRQNTNKTKENTLLIDKKLKQDEEIIDNATITDSELERFLSDYSN